MACARSQVEFVGVKSEPPPQWGWFVALGAVLLVLGLFAGVNLVVATAATVFYVGVLMTVAAALLIVHAFQVKNWPGFFFWIISGGLYTIAGVITLANPALSALSPRGQSDGFAARISRPCARQRRQARGGE